MLTRLEQSEPTTVWFGLWDKVCARRNLQAAFWAVWRKDGAPGVDGQTVRQFDDHSEAELARLGEELKHQRYRRQPARRVWIPKPGMTEKRPLGIPAVRDRTVEAALRNVLEPIFENDFAASSYGFRPGRGCREAVGRVEELLGQGHVWCVDCDLKSYFDTIPHDRLMALIKQRIVDGSVLAVLEQGLKAGVLEELKGWQPTERGTPQGAVISPMLANLYLNPLDHEMERWGWAMVRYADDFVVLCRTKAEAEAVLNKLREWTTAAGLTLHPDQDADCGRHERRLRLLGLALSRREEMAAQEESSEAAGQAAAADAAHPRVELAGNHGQGESDPAGLVRLLPGEPSHGTERSRRMVATTPAGAVAQTGETTRVWVEQGRQSTLAQPMVCETGVV